MAELAPIRARASFQRRRIVAVGVLDLQPGGNSRPKTVGHFGVTHRAVQAHPGHDRDLLGRDSAARQLGHHRRYEFGYRRRPVVVFDDQRYLHPRPSQLAQAHHAHRILQGGFGFLAGVCDTCQQSRRKVPGYLPAVRQ